MSKQKNSSYQENKLFSSRSYESKEEFTREYKRLYYEKAEAKELYLQILTELDRIIALNNADNFKNLCSLFCYISDVENQATLSTCYDDPNNPIKSTNLVILACKHNKTEILKYLFDNSDILNNLSIRIGKEAIAPDDVDETSHNAFYYAIRSSNTELLDTLINKWTRNYFLFNLEELDDILSRTYAELKIKNVALSDEMEIFVENKLLNLRFFSSEQFQNVNTSVSKIKERIELVLENISLLKSNGKVDQRFLFIAKFIAQNIHVLKRQLKSTYDTLPWEEIEFCLISFVSSHVKQQEINLFYHATLNRDKILNHLENFAKKLEDEKDKIEGTDINKLADLPKLKREKIVVEIISNSPQFEELYNDYNQIRDACSLKKIRSYIGWALSADSGKKEEQLIITRSIQVIGEYLKNTLESSKLSSATSELLLISLPKNTREIIIDLRNSLSHAYSLFRRTEIEESADANFFANLQNDIKKVGAVIDDILHDKKLEVIKVLLQRISDSKDPDKIKEIANVLNNIQISDMILGFNSITTKEQCIIKELIKELKNKINDKTKYEEELFNAIDDIINSKQSGLFRFKSDYALESMDFIFGNRIDDNIETVKHIVDYINPKVGSTNLKEVAKLVAIIFKNVELRVQDNHIREIIHKIFCIAMFDTSNIKWIEELKYKLDKSGDRKKGQDEKLKERNYQKRLSQKLSILKNILNKNGLSDLLTEKFSCYKKDGKLQSAVEMLVLDIMSILGGSKNYLENNLLFLDDSSPLLTGKCLRNHLAHDNALVEVLLSDPSVTVILNANKLTIENITESKKKIGKLVTDDPSKLKNRYNQGLVAITNQERMFNALEEGNIEDFKSYVTKGADINARSINLWTTLHFAAKGSNLEIVKYLLDHNINIDAKDIDDKNPLHIAASFGSYEIVRFFIEDKGMDVNCPDNQKRTPVLIATQNGHQNVLELLLKSNADITLKDLDGFAPLHYAVKNDHRNIVKILLEKELNVDINKTKGEFTVLHIASRNNHLELVKVLLTQQADVNAIGYNGWTSLHYAAKNGNKGIAHVLIKKGTDINAKSAQGDTPLHVAAENGNIDVIKVLLKSGAYIDAKSSRNNDTPLHLAAEGGYTDIVKLLLDKGSDANAKDNHNFTPLHIATAYNDNKAVVELLIQKKANINAKCKKGDTPLHIATVNSYKEIIKVLINKDADINIKNDQNRSPIEVVVLRGDIQILRTLLQHKKININSKGNNDFTLLHIAAQLGNFEIVKCLIAKGADINAKTSNGDTPLHLAAGNSHKEVVKVLLYNNANVNSKSNEGFTPLHCASERDCPEIIDILIKKGANVHAKDDKNNITPLYLSALYGNLEVLEVLSNNGADVNAKSINGVTLLHAVATSGNKQIAEALIKKGADFDATDKDTFTPLHLAASAGNNNIVEVLLKNGANVNVKNSRDGAPIELAVLSGHLQVVKTLLHDKRVSINAKDKNDYTLLHIAAQVGNLEIVKYLIEEGADVNDQTSDSNTPLHLAVAGGHKEIIDVLKAHGADINIKDSYNRTAEELESAIAYRNLYGSDDPKVPITSNNRVTKEWLEQILTIRENYYGPNHLKVAEILIHLGKIKMNLEDNQQARDLLERALKIQEKHYDFESFEVVETLVDLGVVYGKLGNPQKEKELLKRALKIQERHEPDNFKVASILINLSVAYGNLGNLQKKKELLERALPIIEKHYGVDHFEITPSLVNLGNTFGALGDVQKQKKFLEKALEIQKRTYGSHHFSIAITLNNLGAAYHYSGDYYGAKDLFEQALTIKEKYYGIDYFTLAGILTNLGTIYGKLGDNQKEKELLERSLKIQKTHYGHNSFKLAVTLTNLGLVYGKLGDLQKKKEFCEQALSLAEGHYGCDNFQVAKILGNLATAYGDLGDIQKAKESLERALEIQKKHYGPDHFEVAETEINLGTAYSKLGNIQKEKEVLEHALTIQEKHYGFSHLELVTTLMKLSMTQGKLGDLQKKKKLIKRALEIQEKHAPDQFVVARILAQLGPIYGNLGDHRKAKDLLERALEIQERHYGFNHSEHIDLLVNLSKAHELLGDYEKQKKLLEKALCISKKYRLNHPNVMYISKKIEIINLGLKLSENEATNILQYLQKNFNTAVINGDIQTVQRLLKEGVNVNKKDIDGRTPLHYAVNNGHTYIVNILLKNEADASQVTNKGNTPLHTAVSKNNKEIVEVLLQHVSRDKLNDFINAKTTSGGTTSLHVAAKNGFLEIIKSLLKHGATYNIENKESKTPIDLSKDQNVINLLKLLGELFEDAKNGNIEIICKLKAIHPDEFESVTNARNNEGNTILQVAIAIANRQKEVVSKLLEMLKKPN